MCLSVSEAFIQLPLSDAAPTRAPVFALPVYDDLPTLTSASDSSSSPSESRKSPASGSRAQRRTRVRGAATFASLGALLTASPAAAAASFAATCAPLLGSAHAFCTTPAGTSTVKPLFPAGAALVASVTASAPSLIPAPALDGVANSRGASCGGVVTAVPLEVVPKASTRKRAGRKHRSKKGTSAPVDARHDIAVAMASLVQQAADDAVAAGAARRFTRSSAGRAAVDRAHTPGNARGVVSDVYPAAAQAPTA